MPGLGRGTGLTKAKRRMNVKRLLVLVLGGALIVGVAASGLAQAPSGTPPKDEKKGERSAETKKVATQNANGIVRTSAAASLVVSGKAKGGKDAEWTFALEPKTKIRKAGKEVGAGDLASGDVVLVRYHDEDGKHVADSVLVRASRTSPAGSPKAETPKKDETKK
jgi:hypothetical protein